MIQGIKGVGMRVLLLEDDTILHEIITEYLTKLGCNVVGVYDGEAALDKAMAEKFDLLLLDVNVPGIGGYELLESIRNVHDMTPAIFITSRNSGLDVEKGFEAGADDYLKKPFDLVELKARIDNIRRRFHIETNTVLQIDAKHRFDMQTNEIITGDKRHQLSHKEGEVLAYFVQNAGRVISFEEILNSVWSYENTPSIATLRTYIKNLRRILGEESFTNIKGVGYRFH